MTPGDIIKLALRNAGVLGKGQTADSDMVNTTFQQLNALIGQWAVKRYLVYHLVNVTVPMTGAASYTVGPTGAFTLSARPSALESAFVSMNSGTPQQVDTPLTVLSAREDFNRVAQKGVVGFPYYAFYDNALPNGILYPYPLPSNLYTVTITVKMPLPAFATLAQDLNLPAEYQEALIYNLAVRARAFYQLNPDPVIIQLAKAALGTVRSVNTQIPLLEMPMGMRRSGRFNVYSGA